jgi:hypothetical protein
MGNGKCRLHRKVVGAMGQRGTDVDGLTIAVHGIGFHGELFRNGDFIIIHLKYSALEFKRVRVLNS